MRVSVIAGLVGYLALFSDVSAEMSQRIPSVGILNYDAVQDIRVNQFRDALRELGYVEGRNLAVTYRWADGVLDRLPDLAAGLVASKVDVIIALGPAVWAAKRTTTTVPIVIAFSGDPVGDGVVSSLAQPGGNITGFSYMSTDLAAKRLELATKTFSKNSRVAILYNPQEPATRLEMRETEAAARTLGVTLQPLAVRHAGELEQAFTAAVSERAEALLADWDAELPRFVRVIPHDYRRVLDAQARMRASGLPDDEAEMAAFEENARDASRVGGN